uniref:DNA ligase 1-like n=1 Tax=Myxine glutinosa TaxID=7769 RepID=UPI00358EB657
MNVGKLFSLGARFEHAVIVMSFTMFIINCLRWISKRVHKHLRKDKEDDREEENGGDSEDDDESEFDSADDDESESDHHDGESESDCQDDDESESDCEDEDDECDCDGGNAEYWSNIVRWLDFVKRNPLNIITRMTTIRRIEPGVEVQNEGQVVPTEKQENFTVSRQS